VRGRVDLFGGGSIRRLFYLSIGVVIPFCGGSELVGSGGWYPVFWCSGVLVVWVLIVVRSGEETEGGQGRVERGQEQVAGWVMEQDSKGKFKGAESHDLETESEFEMDINDDGEGADIDVENVKEGEVDS
jgi:hypothetical protein